MMKKEMLWMTVMLVLAALIVPCIDAQRPDPGHPASEVGGGVAFNGSFGNFTFPGDHALKIPTTTDCSSFTSEGDLCWDSDDDILYGGYTDGYGDPQITRMYSTQEDLVFGDGVSGGEVRMYYYKGGNYISIGDIWHDTSISSLKIDDDLLIDYTSASNDDCLLFGTFSSENKFCWIDSLTLFNISQNLSVGDQISVNLSNRMIQVGKAIGLSGGSSYYGRYTIQGPTLPGFVFGESATYRGYYLYNTNQDYAYIGNTQAGTDYDVLYFKDDHLGINDYTPTAELEIYDGDDADDNVTLRMRSAASNSDVLIEFYTYLTPQMSMEYDSDANRLIMYDLNPTKSQRFSFLRNGTMGINTNTPGAALHVYGGTCVDDDTSCVNHGNGGVFVENGIRTGATNTHIQVGGCNNGLNMNCIADTASPTIAHATTDESLFIEEDLEVDGYIYLDGLGNVSSGTMYYVRWAGNNHNVYVTTSSKRYKENIFTMDEDFRKILEAEPRSFTRKDTGTEDTGYIAEELHDAGLERLVLYNEEGLPDDVDYEKESIYLLELAKDHRRDIESLEKDIAGMKVGLASLGMGGIE